MERECARSGSLTQRLRCATVQGTAGLRQVHGEVHTRPFPGALCGGNAGAGLSLVEPLPARRPPSWTAGRLSPLRGDLLIPSLDRKTEYRSLPRAQEVQMLGDWQALSFGGATAGTCADRAPELSIAGTPRRADDGLGGDRSPAHCSRVRSIRGGGASCGLSQMSRTASTCSRVAVGRTGPSPPGGGPGGSGAELGPLGTKMSRSAYSARAG